MTLAGSTFAVSEFKNPASRPAAVDPIDAEVIMHGLCAIPNLIDKNVTRTAFSFLISEYKDYATGIVDRDGRLISQCRGGLPIFCANALCAAVRDGLKVYGKAGMQHGDVVISNDAATLGQHLNNVVMYTPIRVSETDDGLIGFMVIVMHWVDVGGITIGSCQSPNTTDVFQEGIQFPTIKLLMGGERVSEIYRLIERNTRFPRLVLGDVESQVAGCLMGRDQVLDLAKRYGEDAIRSAIEMFWTKSELATRKAIAEIPDGEYRASAFLDDDGIHHGVPIKINVVVRIEGSDIIVDLSDIADQVQGPLNAGYEGGAVAAARIACKYIFSANEPANDGAFRPIKVICPTGKFLAARPTAPIGGSGFTIPTVVDTILRALAAAVPQRVPAAHHGTYGIHVVDGKLPGGDDYFQNIESSVGGWGAAGHRDGTGPFRSNAHGDTKEVPIELQEASYPYIFEWVRLRQDSGGAGKFRGGLGIEKSYRVLAPCRLTTNMERTKCAPWGLDGGREGKVGRIEVHREGVSPVILTKAEMKLQPGDCVRVFTAGGGGYGDPKLREHRRVLNDVLNGYISSAAAAADYGVDVDETACEATSRTT
jgi:N-methylhydantoinase B